MPAGLPMNGFSTGTGQTQSFSEIAFAFRITPEIVLIGMAFAVAMGVLGGLLPALRGARLPITSALRRHDTSPAPVVAGGRGI